MKLKPIFAAMAIAGALSPPIAFADGDEITALRDQLDLLKQQVEMMESRLANAEFSAVKAKKQKPAAETATEWLAQSDIAPAIPDSIVHLAGYGDATFVEPENGDAGFGSVKFAPIFHYQYKDLFLFESELEVEVDDTGETEVVLEYVTVDVSINDNMMLVAGKFLSPTGQFVQNLHPSWINKLPSAPVGFGHDGAAPSADVGAQLRGGFELGNGRANYAFYAANGPRLEVEFEAAEEEHDKYFLAKDEHEEDEHGGDEPIEGEFEIHGIETEGFINNDDGEFVFGGRVGYLPWSNLEIGISLATGEVGLYEEAGLIAGENTRDYDVFGMDFYWSLKNFQLRGEYISQEIGGDVTSIVPDEAEISAWYTQGAYRWPGTKWESVLRYSDLSAIEAHNDQEQFALGLNYLFASNVIAKFSYELNDGEAGSTADNDRFVMQLAYGF